MATIDTAIGKCICDPRSAHDFMLAGNAYLTLVSKKSGVRYTYHVSLAKETVQTQQQSFWKQGKPEQVHTKTWFVSLLKGPDNTADYVYLGIIQNDNFRLTRKSRMTSESVPVKAFSFAFSNLSKQNMPVDLEVWHHGRCGRCGRMLTVPESIERGIGPECAGKFYV